ncbi:MAG: triose-phosphate isomerase [Ignavibacteriales bacterium]|nr:triose-phosphate isomerase [Ignavibacteriales bacterium]
MRKKVIAGNWKMNNDISQSINLVKGIKSILQSTKADVIVCPPYTSLSTVQQLVNGSFIKLGAQDVSVQNDGAYTGEISLSMLKAVGCEYVIVGHSERRQYHKETNELINTKAKKVLGGGLTPIICIGETLDEREKGITDQILTTQTKGVLAGLTSSEVEKSIVAYEPVWAIGTGKTATPQQADDAHKLIRKVISQLYSWATAEKVIIQYGGSVKPDNAKELLSQPNIDGALVGGACLKADSFAAIINAA